MFVTGTFLQGSVGLGGLPTLGLLVGGGHAAALMAAALVVCCGCLWLLSRRGDPDAAAIAAAVAVARRAAPQPAVDESREADAPPWGVPLAAPAEHVTAGSR